MTNLSREAEGTKRLQTKGWESFWHKSKRRLKFIRHRTTWLEQEFAKRGPWLTRFTIDGKPYGGERCAEEDARIPPFFDNFPEAHSVLELGCLEGGQTFELAKRPGVHVLAIEGRGSSIERARFVQELLGIKNVNFVLGNLETIDLTRFGKFDAVFCCGILYHVPEPWKLVEKIRAVTTKLYIWTHYAAEDKADQVVNGFRGCWYQECGLGDPQSGLSPRSFWPTFQSLQDILKQYGFTIIKIVANEPHTLPAGPFVVLAARAEDDQP